RDEQPGKILHEVRVGEFARVGAIPHTPFYGAVDTAPLFLILLAQHAHWTGDLSLFRELRGHVEAALRWIAEYGDLDGDGYVEYDSPTEPALINQGWKDSGNAIANRDGTLATPPIALVEIQGYVYQAKQTIADLYERDGAHEPAQQLRQEADALRQRFNQDFWLEKRGFFALALQRDKKPVEVISSNPGHALWAGIVDPNKAEAIIARLVADDMWNGWGIRTLAKTELSYNPIGYHLGTVWPHDNAIIAEGFRRYGHDEDAHRLFSAIVQAAMRFESYQLPEVFAGFSRSDYDVPVHFPVACHPQAWASGSVPHLLSTLLGLVPDGFDRRLRVVRPMLPDFVDRLEIRRLRLAGSRMNLLFMREGERVVVERLDEDGELELVVEQ
ncbi:MAG: amylo-alpha-1,6-glucosidase, partial [Chloroflexota bacterium]|nr:amylo-alpha-1,6-glucosidase [Chloroflexota bacterium]